MLNDGKPPNKNAYTHGAIDEEDYIVQSRILRTLSEFLRGERFKLHHPVRTKLEKIVNGALIAEMDKARAVYDAGQEELGHAPTE